jgi:hypothetical protein
MSIRQQFSLRVICINFSTGLVYIYDLTLD